MGTWFGLYYPHVHFRDDHILKIVALHLDGLFHLSDASAVDSMPRISRTELALAEAGFLRPVAPAQEDINRTAERFIATLSGLDASAYQVSAPAPVSVYDLDQALALWKVDPTLVDLLMEAGMAWPVGRDRLAVDSLLAHAYLLSLGSELAPRLGAFPLADDAVDQAIPGLTARRLIAGMSGAPLPLVAHEEQPSMLINLAITAVLPRDLRACPVHKIIAFRERYPAERARFRQAIEDLVAEATHTQGITDREVLAQHLRARYDHHLAPALTELESAMRGLRIDTALGAMNVQAAAPAAVATTVAMLTVQPSAPQATAIAAGGLALGWWTSARQARAQRQEELSTSQVSYLYHLRHNLAPLALAEQARAAAARFAPPWS